MGRLSGSSCGGRRGARRAALAWPLSACALLAAAPGAEGKLVSAPTVRFTNSGTEPLVLSWLQTAPEPQLRRLRAVAPGKTTSEGTIAGHVFSLASEDGTASTAVEVLGYGTVTCFHDRSKSKSTGLGHVECQAEWERQSDYEGEAWDAFVQKAKEECTDALAAHPTDAAHFCHGNYPRWPYMQCKYEATEEEWREAFMPEFEKGVKITREQPQKYMNFTDVGYKATSIPSGLWKELQAFWMSGRLSERSVPAQGNKLNGVLAACESDVWLLELTDELREKIYTEVAPIISKWSGVPVKDLRRSAIYGVRMYRKNSALYMHVDKWESHALSAILEVGHLSWGRPDTDIQGVEQWPLEAVGHSGRVGHVPSKAGQMILYESATVPHGRPTSFKGREFANLFVHFAPVGWPEAYEAPGFKQSAAASSEL